MYEKCPKCGYQRQPTDSGDSGVCSRCGLVFLKWLRNRAGVVPERDSAATGPQEPGLVAGWWRRAQYVPDRTDPIQFWGRVALYAAFFAWGWYFILLDFRTNDIGESFLHRVNLVFHEAGHVVFIPLGRFMTILGGSLGQLLMPLIVLGAFLWKNRDGFAASIALWWLGQSLMDVAPYINDARALELPLLGGGTGMDRPDSHDWNNILFDLNLLRHDHRIAWMADALGSVVVLVALVWGGYLLYRQFQNLPGR